MQRRSLGPLAALLCAPEGNDSRGAQVVARVAAGLRRDRPGVNIAEAVPGSSPTEAGDYANELAELGFRVIAIPLLLSGGHEVERAVLRTAGGSDRITVTEPLGPHHSLTSLLWRRVQQTGARPDAAVVVATGLLRPRAAQDLADVASWLGEHWSGPVSVGDADAPGGVAAAVESARREAGQVAIASYLLGYGYGRGLLDRAGADLVTDPLGAAPLVISRVRDLFDHEVARQRLALDADVA